MVSDTACEALRRGKRLELRYDGYSRVVEVHAVGVTKEDHGIIRVYQVRGGSASHDPVGWKLFRTDEVSSAHIMEESSDAPRRGYKRGDKAMERIKCEIR